MMKKIIICLTLALVLLGNVGLVGAQEKNKEVKQRERVLSEVGKRVVFEASSVVNNTGDYSEFHWSFGDGGSAEGSGVLHTYVQPGYYEVKLVVVGLDEKESEFFWDVYVYNALLVGVIDNTVDREQMSQLEREMFADGNLLWVIEGREEKKTVDEITDQVISSSDILDKSEGIIIWGAGNFGLDLLVKLAQRGEMDLSDLNVAVVSGGRLASLVKTANSAFNIVNSKSLILVGDNALEFIGSFEDVEVLEERLQSEAIDYELVGI
ncbi:PKD domain-containing protein, partial [Patescibacteria group bacterium]|nr:PKD domain-containing protein [Patescibacteria group bacterium]